MVFSPIVVGAATTIVDSGTCGDNLNWRLDSEGILTISGIGAMYDWNFSSEVPWNNGRKSIKRVVVEPGVTTIGHSAFNGCKNLESIEIPDGVIYIDDYAFYDCKNLISIKIPESVTYIGNYAFAGCQSLANIAISKGVTHIGDGVFMDCVFLTSINVDTECKNYCSENGVLFNKNKTSLICYPANKTERYYVVPTSVTTIEAFAFRACSTLINIDLHENLTKIRPMAFSYCSNLIKIVLPKSLSTIDKYVFCGCASLKNIFIPVSVTIISDYPFMFCDALTDIYYGGTTGQWYDISRSTGFFSAVLHVNSCSCFADYLHKYSSGVTTPVTHTTTGVMTYTCTCGDTYTETIDKLAGHTYTAVTTAPTCTEQGYTTYTCACTDRYIADYVKENGHTEELVNEKAATATNNGYTGDLVCSVCGELIEAGEIISAIGTNTNSCSHMCHKTGFMGFIWEIVQFFWKLFKINPICECGAAHY